MRNVNVPTYHFVDYFIGFEKVEAVKRIFEETTKEVLRNLKVEFNSGRGYTGVSDQDEHLRINANYLNNGEKSGRIP